jgi:DNA primase
VIVVEGRADVNVLLRNGIKNVVAIEGTSVPPVIAELSKQKEVTAFLDGDRGGDLIMKELMATADIDFVARAPRGREVEDLTKKELFKSLRDRVPADQAKMMSDERNGERSERPERPERHDRREERREERREDRRPSRRRIEPETAQLLHNTLEELTGTRAAYLIKEGGEIIGKVPLREVYNALRELQADIIVLDGEADQRLVNFAAQRGVKLIAAMKCNVRSVPENIQVVTAADFG